MAQNVHFWSPWYYYCNFEVMLLTFQVSQGLLDGLRRMGEELLDEFDVLNMISMTTSTPSNEPRKELLKATVAASVGWPLSLFAFSRHRMLHHTHSELVW